MAIATRSLSRNSPTELSPVSSIASVLEFFNQTTNEQSSTSPHSLDRCTPNLKPNSVVRVIKSLKDPQLALHFFKWASNENHHCYAAIVDSLISNSLFSTAEKLLIDNGKFSDFMISKFIKAFGDRGDIRGAIHWFNRVKQWNLTRSVFSYNTLLGVLVKANRINLARALYEQILDDELVNPDVSTYTTLVRGFCKLGLIDDAKKVFDEMKCRPNIITYNTLIDGLCKRGSLREAREILDRMLRSKDCLPDAVTFTTLIDGHCKKGELEEAMKCMDEMEKSNCEPNLITYNSLINGLCVKGKIDEANKMMSRMRLNGFKPDLSTHTSVLKGLCVLGELENAAKLLKEMVSKGLKPDRKSYGVLFNAYCMSGCKIEALALLEEMKSRGVVPHVSSFNSLLRAFCDSGELERAVLILKQMPQMGCSANFISYSTIICGLCKCKGKMQDVEDLVYAMICKGHKLDISMYSWMIMGYCENNDVQMALGIVREMIEKGFAPNIQSFSAIIKELLKDGKASDAIKIFEEICRRCHILDVDGYRMCYMDMELQGAVKKMVK